MPYLLVVGFSLDVTVRPGALAALAAVDQARGHALVVSDAPLASARQLVAEAGLPADAVVVDAQGPHKAAALLEHGASVHVCATSLDVAAARAAGAVSVALVSGARGEDGPTCAGADFVLEDLTKFPAWLYEHLLVRRMSDLRSRLQDLGSILVAFSGGADSALLLAAAARALGPDRVVAATASSASLPAAELVLAREFAAGLGVRHVEATTHEMDRDGYRANAGDRCYFCKAELVEVLIPIAGRLGLAAVATGTNADDAAAGFRPGIRAAADRSAVTPLLDVGLTKDQIREASRRWGLVTWDKPAAACLSSRIAFGLEVTPERLARVERAELQVRAVLDEHRQPVGQLRVRDLGGVGRVELDAAYLNALTSDPDLERQLVSAVVGTGFEHAVVDPAGFRSGSMNELLDEPDRYR